MEAVKNKLLVIHMTMEKHPDSMKLMSIAPKLANEFSTTAEFVQLDVTRNRDFDLFPVTGASMTFILFNGQREAVTTDYTEVNVKNTIIEVQKRLGLAAK
jgi:hypothetical protein